MKIPAHRDEAFPQRRKTSAGLAVTTAVVLAVLASAASADDPGGPGGSGNPGVSGGDETIGTLPVIGPIRIQVPMVRGWRGDHPAFYLEGSVEQLSTVIQGARGRGFATYELVDAPTGRVRIAFHGQITMALDREAMGTFGIQSGLAVPPSFGPGRGTVQFGAQAQRTVRLRAGLLPLAVASMSADGTLDRGSLEVHAYGSHGRSTSDRIRATPSTLILQQSD
jgi:hypothetical protein